MEQAYQINDGIYDLKKDILDCIYNHELVKNKYVENDIDHVCRVISFSTYLFCNITRDADK